MESFSIDELIESAIAFTNHLINNYPQVNEDGELNYYLCGSLAVMLLSQADSMRLNNTGEEVVLPECFKTKLSIFARQIGDLDYVRTEAYNKALTEANECWRDKEKYKSLRSRILLKGGGGPKIADLSDLAKKIIINADKLCGIMCDPLTTFGDDKIVIINLVGIDLFIAEPKQLFSYKVLHLIESFNNKPEKFKRDFKILYDSMLELYSEEELVDSAYNILKSLNKEKIRGGLNKLCQNPEFNSSIKPFFDKLISYDKSKERLFQ